MPGVVKGNLILKQKNSKLQIHLLEQKVNAINTFTTALNANVVVADNDEMPRSPLTLCVARVDHKH